MNRSGQATNISAVEGESVSLEPDSKSPVLEQIDEVEVAPAVTVLTPSVNKTTSILEQLAENVPWTDDESWQ